VACSGLTMYASSPWRCRASACRCARPLARLRLRRDHRPRQGGPRHVPAARRGAGGSV